MLATWKRVPFALTVRCVHGPLIAMADSDAMARNPWLPAGGYLGRRARAAAP